MLSRLLSFIGGSTGLIGITTGAIAAVLAGAVVLGAHHERAKNEHRARVIEQRIADVEVRHTEEAQQLHSRIAELEAMLDIEAASDPNADNLSLDEEAVKRIGELK